jgi:hypothetical protein
MMELFTVIIVGVILYAIFSQSEQKSKVNKPVVSVDDIGACEVLEEKKTIINNVYIQNNVYVQYNNYSSKSEAHTEAVWKRKGYSVKYGETYAYKHYGNEIFTEDQVTSQRYIRSRSMEIHTYDAWLDLGYQVRKGSRAIGGSGGYSTFDRDQVAWVG